MSKLSHIDEEGNAFMVDVSGKEVTMRTAVAEGRIRVSGEVFRAVTEGTVKKGDVLTVAQVSGIMAAKRTPELIPMCHVLRLSEVKLTFSLDEEESTITARCFVRAEDKTGVEMEALTGASAALLTVYDMCKSLDKRMVIEAIHLLEKTGGKSGNFRADGEIPFRPDGL